MKQKIFILVALLGATAMLSGCWPFPSSEDVGKKIVEKAIESQTGGKVDIDTDKETMNIKTEGGSFSAGEEVKIPDGFPEDVFMLSDAKLVFSMSGISGEEGFSLSYITATSTGETFAKYKEEMASDGWKKESEMDMGEQGKILNFIKGEQSVMVTIGTNEDEENKGKTQVGITVVDDSAETDSQ